MNNVLTLVGRYRMKRWEVGNVYNRAPEEQSDWELMKDLFGILFGAVSFAMFIIMMVLFV